METIAVYLAAGAAIMWCAVLLLPWRAWSTRERIERWAHTDDTSLGDITALVPARNESGTIGTTLRSLAAQGNGMSIVLVDDQSSDNTVAIARESVHGKLTVVTGQPLPAGWSGKVWALEQGRSHVRTRLTLLVDADIELRPGLVAALQDKLTSEDRQMVSLMVTPRMEGFWERLLMPAFVYFFKLLYPFHIANSRFQKIAAAAGGCILIETRVIDAIGGFAALKGALIDDCTLAGIVKAHGHRPWIGLTRSAVSLRSGFDLGDIWNMVARSAFTQLRYSAFLLGVCTALLALGFWIPVAGLLVADPTARTLACVALATMMATYVPVLRFYDRSASWALAMPFIGTLFLAMTWTSAIRYWRGERARWKDRSYSTTCENAVREPMKTEEP